MAEKEKPIKQKKAAKGEKKADSAQMEANSCTPLNVKEKISQKEKLCETIGGEGCGLKRVLDIIGGKWKIMILCLIDFKGVGRFNDMKREIYGITNTMLSASLREMEEDGLVERKQYNEMPLRVEYTLTPKAESMIPILLELKAWGENNLISQ